MLTIAIRIAEWNTSEGVVQIGVRDWFGAATFLGYAFLLSAV